MNTLATSLAFVGAYINYTPVTIPSNNGEPAISISNMIVSTILNPPNTWGFNRNENTSTTTVAGTQDYQTNITDLHFIERVSLTDTTGKIWEVDTVYNNAALSVQSTQGRPKSVCVKTNNLAGTNAIRFSLVPDAVYTVNITYQKLPVQLTSTSSGWSGIPDAYEDIYNNLLLSEAYSVALDDASAQKYRVRGMAALISKVEGLSEMQKNLYMTYALAGDVQTMLAQLRTNQVTQARGI